ncbi:glycosyltransferase family 4 protein [Candidatus Woesearchaeota archaeon]|nr:glycosyltransferase family 4 protein [Candidatus Woesearchaeota archaeon]
MKILFVLENYIPLIGGVEALFRNLCEGLAAMGHDVTVVTHRAKGTKSYELINGVKVHRIWVPGFFSRHFFTFLAVPKAVRLAGKSDVIHTTTFNGGPAAWITGKLAGKKVLITVHEVWLGRWGELGGYSLPGKAFHEIAERLIYLLPFDAYAGVSGFTAKELVKTGVPSGKVHTVYNPVDYRHFRFDRHARNRLRKRLGLEGKFVVLGYGRPGLSKGFEHLVAAIPEIRKLVPDCHVVLILSRDPQYARRYRSLASRVKNSRARECTTMLEPVGYNELPGYLSMADCVVVPSLSEGFGYAVAEPCAVGTPVVASDVASIPEVASGKFLLVKAKDSPAIARGVLAVRKKKYRKAALRKFPLQKTIEGYLRIYRRLL